MVDVVEAATSSSVDGSVPAIRDVLLRECVAGSPAVRRDTGGSPRIVRRRSIWTIHAIYAIYAIQGKHA